MVKYRCIVCGYIYDPEMGDPDFGIKPGTHLKNCQMIGFARFLVYPKISLKRQSE